MCISQMLKRMRSISVKVSLTRPGIKSTCTPMYRSCDNSTYPISLPLEERVRLLEDLRIDFLLAQTVCEMRRVGVHLKVQTLIPALDSLHNV